MVMPLEMAIAGYVSVARHGRQFIEFHLGSDYDADNGETAEAVLAELDGLPSLEEMFAQIAAMKLAAQAGEGA